MTLPQVGATGTAVFAVLSLIIGVIMGTQCSWWLQLIAIVVLFFFIKSKSVSRLELGGLSYAFWAYAFIIGMIVGDISYILQTGITLKPIDIFSPFEAHSN